MSRRQVILLAALVLALIALHLVPFSPIRSYRIADESLRGLESCQACISDSETAEGNAELLLTSGSSLTGGTYTGPEGGWLIQWQVNLSGPGHVLAYLDMTGDGVSDVLLLRSDPDSSRWLELYDRAGEARGEPQPRWRAGPFLAGLKQRIDGKVGLVYVCDVLDIDGDGRLELIVFLYPFAPGKLPRSLLAFRGDTGELLWRHEFAPVVSLAGMWISPDGRDRRLIVITTHAPGNHFRVGDTTDLNLYVWALAPDGSDIWRCQVPADEGASLWWPGVDFDADGKKDFVLVLRDPNAPPGRVRSALLRLDPAAGRLETINAHLPFPNSTITYDVDADGRPELLWLGANETLLCLDHGLSLRCKVTRRNLQHLWGAADLDGDGRAEILASDGNIAVVLSSAHGRVLARRDFPPASGDAPGPDQPAAPPEFSLHRIAGHTSIFVRTPTRLRTARLERSPWHPLYSSLSLAALALAIGAVVAQGRRRRDAMERDLDTIDHEDRLLTAMTQYQHDGGSQRKLSRIGRLLRNWSEWDRADQARWADIGAEFTNYTDRLLAEIMQIAAIARGCALPADCARTLAPDAQDLAALLVSLQPHVARLAAGSAPLAAAPDGAPGDAEAPQAEAAARAHAAFAKVDDGLRQIRRELRRRNRCRIVEVAARCVQQRRQDGYATGATLRFEALCAPDVIAHVSPVVLDKVVDNLIANALRAVAHQERREITVTISASDTSCRLDVRDTGAGLELRPEEWDRVFDRAYTTRPRLPGEEPGGSGLNYAREKLAAFEGLISVIDSRPNEGATFSVILQRGEE